MSSAAGGTDAAPRGRAAAPGSTPAPASAAATGSVEIHEGDNLEVIRRLPDASFTLIYLDPPFNTGRPQERSIETARSRHPSPAASSDARAGSLSVREQRVDETMGGSHGLGDPVSSRGVGGADRARGTRGADAAGVVRRGFHGREYERIRGDLRAYDDRFDDYWGFLEPRLLEAWRLLADDGTLYLHLDYREAHYAKVLMDALVGRERFLNELIWAYDYGAKTRKRWPTKHDTILVYVKDPKAYWFDSDAVDREPYMAPGLVTPEKAERGKLPTDVWWHTIVPTTGREKTGYPTQKPEGILRRIVQASSRPGDRVLDFFAGSGTTGAVASALGRDAVLVDHNPEAIAVMRERMPHARVLPAP
ncbi:DNA-methyltransferase [Microbacterium psychrotolerans]|uniref:DNA-methyltransferase n=1 Tax=Microbacterium psychrotolerans TaxID=3068321 RepID=UPI003AB0341D